MTKQNNETGLNQETQVKKPTAKRQKYLDKLAKKQAHLYTKEEREEHVELCIAKIDELGISDEFECVQEIYKVLNTWVKTGASSMGKIPMHGLKRVFWYILPSKKPTEPATMLKYDASV